MKIFNLLFESRIKQINSHLLVDKPLFLIKTAYRYFLKFVFKKDLLRGAVFASSYQCNFHCSHCYALKFRNAGIKEPEFYEKAAIIKECLKAGVMAFDFVGGEIGITPDFINLLKICRPKRTFISLASNAFALTKEKVKDFKKAGVDQISISIDGGTEQEHDEFRRQPGSFRKCFEALDIIREEGMNPVIITCVARSGTRKKPFRDLVDYAIKTRTQLIFTPLIPFGELEGNLDILCDEEDLDYMKEMHKKYPFLTRDNYENMGEIGCPGAKQVIYVSEYGDVMPCPFLHISFGNIMTESLVDIREQMLKLPELKRYNPRCLAGEETSFIKNHLAKLANIDSYPITAEKVFSENKDLFRAKSFHKNIAKIDRPCPLCGSWEREVISSGREHEFKDTTQDLFFVVKCKNCDLVYLNPRPDKKELDIIYPKNYCCHNEQYSEINTKRNFLVRLKNYLNHCLGFPSRIRQVLKLIPKQSQIKILDVGCGSGGALDVFRESCRGALTTGIDFDERAINITAAKGHSVIKAKIEDVELAKENFDIIYSSNVIEHVSDPFQMFQKVAFALKPSGIFFCETPDFDSVDSKLFAKSGHWGGFHFPRHWTFFTPKTLEKIADKAGLKLEKIKHSPVPIFWIWSMHSLLYRGLNRKKLADRLFPLIENRQNFFISFLNKIIFTLIDIILEKTVGRTGVMCVVFRKK
ncbi:methyltransferase domain-containing protein [Patescibacteria group bacterium]|nr:methyltransferase domain-containing protein [Patescibacteria group bacterium]MBU4458370.1 methyltransferase domain-containing protein [Patescibacteria group bacterium]MCG2695875.1 methyltransferase domain-containing protein [Candidatus Portnoybacteria bacterium]